MEKYLYNVKHRQYEDQLCALEMRALFGFDLQEKVFFSTAKVNPSISPYIKNRLKIIYKFSRLEEIVNQIKTDGFSADDFFVKYVSLTKDDAFVKDRKVISKKVGYVIIGFPSFDAPKVVYGVTHYRDFWYFGELLENDPAWRDHNDKPFTYSSSIDMNVAKALLNIGTRGDMRKTVVDPCCGVGTVLLEGRFAGYDICGWEINDKVAESARANLAHYGYMAHVTTGDIADIKKTYDVSIVDLPYGNFTPTTKVNQAKILKHAKRIAKRVVLVSSEDMLQELSAAALHVVDHCSMVKRSNRNFVRHVWVCES
jgi:tRNA G10  N-methylase Trm11